MVLHLPDALHQQRHGASQNQGAQGEQDNIPNQGPYSQNISKLKVAHNSSIQEKILKIMDVSVLNVGLLILALRVFHSVLPLKLALKSVKGYDQ